MSRGNALQLDIDNYSYSPCCASPNDEIRLPQTCSSPILISESLADLESSFLRQFQATTCQRPPDCPGIAPCSHNCHSKFPPCPAIRVPKPCVDSSRICDEECTPPPTPPRCALQSRDSCPALTTTGPCPALTPPCPALIPSCPAREPPPCPAAKFPKPCVDSRKLCEEQCSLRDSFESLPSPCPSYLEELLEKFPDPLKCSTLKGSPRKSRGKSSPPLSPKRGSSSSRLKSFFSRSHSPKNSPPGTPSKKKQSKCKTPPKSPCPGSPRLRLCSSPPQSPPRSPPGSPCSRIPRPCSPKPACPGSPRRPCAASPRSPCCKTPPSKIPCPAKSPSCSPRPRSPCGSLVTRSVCPKPASPCSLKLPRCPKPPPSCCPKPPSPCEPRDPPEQSSVASTLMDIVSKIASYATGPAECQPEDCTTIEVIDKSCSSPNPCSKPCPRPVRRCVHFLPQPRSCARDLEELFFNQELKKSDASVDCDLCDECDKQSSPPCAQLIKDMKLEPCPSALELQPQAEDQPIAQLKSPRHCLYNRCDAMLCYAVHPNRDYGESGACSSAGSAASVGACDAARAHYYHSKLLATLQVLQNKEETVRVQAESLAVAEQRIATLTVRAAQMRRELERNACELRALRKSSCPSNANRTGVCNGTQSPTQEVENQKNMVITLQNNLTVIEELYRECFYETAKQEELIENLRKSYLDVRLMEKEKADQIGQLQNVINSQKWSLERCQDVAMEVENLKLEISNFLNNSNNDSGMWEQSVAGEVGEELQDIMQQLRQLRDLLQTDCNCGLQEENMKLKERNQALECEVGEHQRKTCELECALESKDGAIRKFKKQLDENNEQMQCLRQEIQCLQQREEERQRECQCLQLKLQEATTALEEKCAELCRMQDQCNKLEETVRELRQDLERADQIIKENCRVRSEVSYLSQQVCLWRRQLADSEARVRGVEAELLRARDHCRNIDQCYREKARAAAALQEQLEEAHARGIELSAEARRVVSAVRSWVRRMRATNCEQEERIKEQEACIVRLKKSLAERPCGPRPCSNSYVSRVEVGCSKCAPRSPTVSTSPTPESSANECGREAAPAPRRPPRKASCISRGTHLFGAAGRSREAGVQQPARAHAGAGARPPAAGAAPARVAPARVARIASARFNGVISPTEELFDRVERLSEALADGQRRWSRTKLPTSPR